MKSGKIVESGNHKYLMSLGGRVLQLIYKKEIRCKENEERK